MRATTIAVAVAVAAAAATIAGASDHGREEHEEHEGREHEERGRGAARAPAAAGAAAPDAATRALYRKECGACHLDFPPGLLPAESHRRIMAGLEKHFGQNAELDATVAARLERYLVANAAGAGTHRKSRKMAASLPSSAAPLRITEVPYFQQKHRKIRADVVARPAVKSLANCAACHRTAQDWTFDDDDVKIPAATP